MDDDLMRLFGGERMKHIMTKIGMEPGEPIYHPWLTKGIENAQKKVEERNFEIRKNLIDYDDVLNDQREYIYEQRDGILSDEKLSERIMLTAQDYLDQWFEEYSHNRKNGLTALLTQIRENFGISASSGRCFKRKSHGASPERFDRKRVSSWTRTVQYVHPLPVFAVNRQKMARPARISGRLKRSCSPSLLLIKKSAHRIQNRRF